MMHINVSFSTFRELSDTLLPPDQIRYLRRMLGLGRRINANRNSAGGYQPIAFLDALVAAGGAHRVESVDDWLRRRYSYSLTRKTAEAVLRPGEDVDAIYFLEEESLMPEILVHGTSR